MADNRHSIIQECNRKNACHSGPVRIRLRRPKNFIVCNRDRLPNSLLGAAGLTLEAAADPAEGDLRRLLTSSFTANTVNHDENSAFGVDVDAILVVGPEQPHVAAPRASKARSGRRGGHLR